MIKNYIKIKENYNTRGGGGEEKGENVKLINAINASEHDHKIVGFVDS